MDFIVTKKATRPVGDDSHCFYCGEEIGQPHQSGCVLVNKMVKIKMTLSFETDVPSTWTEETIVSFFNGDSGWCANNAINYIIESLEREGCLCGRSEFELLKDGYDYFLDEE